MARSQIKLTESSLADRISDLPSNIIECILDRVAIRDAVATSILSKQWRHKWRGIRNLVFDTAFVDHIVSDEPAVMKLVYSNIIGKILSLHLGPIQKFFLCIPSFFDDWPQDLGYWMLLLSQKEVKELVIEGRHVLTKLRMPSYIFHCNELQHMKIDAWTLYLQPLHDFGGFRNLISLDLISLRHGDGISHVISKCPLLERLSLQLVGFSYPFVINAPRLRFLYVCFASRRRHTLELKDRHSITAISLRFCRHKVFIWDLFHVLGSVPKVETVTLRYLQKIAVPSGDLTSFPTTLHYLNCLTLLDINISSWECIYLVLCILEGSPNLQKLNLGVKDDSVSLNLPSGINTDKAALNFLDMQA